MHSHFHTIRAAQIGGSGECLETPTTPAPHLTSRPFGSMNASKSELICSGFIMLL
jgi:hypothetical protein